MEDFKPQEGSVEHRWTESSAAIKIHGLDQDVRMLHLTDTHITCSAPADKPFRKYSARMDDAFVESRRHGNGEMTEPIRCFEDSLGLAGESGAGRILLTGDIVNNPSATSVEAVKSRLDGTGIDYLYTAGNHDWHYEGMDGSPEELRARWRADRLLPLYSIEEARTRPDCFTVRIGNFLIVCLDNSTYQVNEEQLEVFRDAVDTRLPMLLVMHIPLAIDTMNNMLFGHPDWGAATDKNYIIERRERWPDTGNTAVTKAFVDALVSAPNLVAILAGHTHTPHVGRVAPRLIPDIVHPTALQYVTRAGAHGGYRVVDFIAGNFTIDSRSRRHYGMA